MNVSAQSLEDAANIASEFIYSLDNIPNEIRHILEEIKYKESRTQELQSQIDSDGARWIKHTLRGAANSVSASPTKSVSHLPAKINESYVEIDRLSEEKLALAERVVDLITRTCTRLDVDLDRTRVLQGDTSSDIIRGRSVSVTPSVSAMPGIPLAVHPAVAIGESLKQVLNPSLPTETRHSVSTPVSAPPPKKRKVTASGPPSIKLPPSRSLSPAAPTTKSASHTRSRLSRQSYPPPRKAKIDLAKIEREDEEAEAEEPEGEDEDDDHKLYCFCQKPSAGDMIACDNNSGCPYEWFHLECVGIKEPPPDTMKWYCPICIDKVTVRKGRKKS
ncbi:hypothetical protein BDP27DRAFT_1401140 [Rhodocollybia butyracea]|uniref:Chromatin modification-related protein n=1 Tax=Rhodocollybia butyracea TaxID=206335 RepID=A0A9P5PZN7_9AGAR|nr:hypothetical protein BDP27DRAFT_1401140 [Rhodocollybia butyracea]